MNIYARYFDQEVLVHNYDELMGFLASIPEIPINARLEEDVRSYRRAYICPVRCDVFIICKAEDFMTNDTKYAHAFISY